MSQPSVRSFFSKERNNNQSSTGSSASNSSRTSDTNSQNSTSKRKRKSSDDPDDIEQQPQAKLSTPAWVNKSEIMSIKDICDNADKWAVLEVDDKIGAHKSTVYESKAGIPADFAKVWLYIETIKISDILINSPHHFEKDGAFEKFTDEDDGGIKDGCDRVIDLLCSICIQNFSRSDLGSLCNKNGLVFINVPRGAPFGSIREILKYHEFGKKMKGDLWKTGPVKLREKILAGELDKNVTSSTAHMRFQMELRSQKEVLNKSTRPDLLLNKKGGF